MLKLKIYTLSIFLLKIVIFIYSRKTIQSAPEILTILFEEVSCSELSVANCCVAKCRYPII